MPTIPPHPRLNNVENSAYFKEVCQDNFEVLAEELAKRVATYQNGSPTTVIGPPTSGARVLNEFWPAFIPLFGVCGFAVVKTL